MILSNIYPEWLRGGKDNFPGGNPVSEGHESLCGDKKLHGAGYGFKLFILTLIIKKLSAIIAIIVFQDNAHHHRSLSPDTITKKRYDT